VTAAPAGEPVLVLREASFGYRDRTTLRDVDLAVPRGEVLVVTGANGSGKSTLVKGILGLADQTGGVCEILGAPRRSFTEHHRVGYVPQRQSVATAIPSTVREVVATGRLTRTPWWAPWRPFTAGERTAVTEAIRVVGLSDRADAQVGQLSGGQQRRVLIARALACEPELFLLDEPTAGVDTANQAVLVAVLARLVERGATLVVVTHELAAFTDLTTRVVEVEAGRIVGDHRLREVR